MSSVEIDAAQRVMAAAMARNLAVAWRVAFNTLATCRLNATSFLSAVHCVG